MQHPDLVMMMERSKRTERARRPQTPPGIAPGALSALRARTGNALIALGTRITPAPQQPLPPASPMRIGGV